MGHMTTTQQTKSHRSFVDVRLSVEDARFVAELLSNRIEACANWMTGSVLRGDGEGAIRHAEERDHLQKVVRAAFNRALIAHEEGR